VFGNIECCLFISVISVTSNTDYGWTWVILINFIFDSVSLPILHDEKKIDFDCYSAAVLVSVLAHFSWS